MLVPFSARAMFPLNQSASAIALLPNQFQTTLSSTRQRRNRKNKKKNRHASPDTFSPPSSSIFLHRKKEKEKRHSKSCKGRGECNPLSLSKRRGKDRKIEGKEEDAYTKRHARWQKSTNAFRDSTQLSGPAARWQSTTSLFLYGRP